MLGATRGADSCDAALPSLAAASCSSFFWLAAGESSTFMVSGCIMLLRDLLFEGLGYLLFEADRLGFRVVWGLGVPQRALARPTALHTAA